MGESRASTVSSAEGWLARWLKRRGPLYPPLELRYRQIFILPTRFGWILGVLMAAMLLGSLNFNNNLGLLTSFVVAGLAVLSMFQAYRNLAGLQVLDIAASPVHAGTPLTLEITLQSATGQGHRGLELRCADAAIRGHVPDGGRTRLELGLPTRSRGWYTAGRLRIATQHPLGLFEAWSWVFPARRFLVYPAPARKVPPLPRTGGQQGKPDRRTEGEEFHSLRAWRAGDPLHRIAWKASQKHDQLLSRQFQAENDQEIHLSLDNAPGANLEERVGILTSWVLMAAESEVSWTLQLSRDQLGPGNDRDHIHQCLKALALVQS